MPPRYGQLSYTSLDGAGRAGGWQIKETAGDLTAADTALLVSRIHLAVNPVEPLPRYPTPEQLRAAPRRMAYRRVDDRTAVYWHTAAAGLDSMGRPGNVFAHILLDRHAWQTESSPRPIELWRSARWLTPYGGSAVAAAALPAEAPAAGGVVTAESVIRFACDTGTWRLGTLCGVLDAVSGALEGGPAVVLGVESPDAAAQWIGAVSFLMSPGTARQLNFSTFNYGVDLEHLLRIGLHLIAVPRADVPDVPHGVVLIDEAETLSLGEFNGQPHRTAGGRDIEVTAWSAMAQVALVDPVSAAQLLADVDEFSSCVVDVGLHPSLPMAIAVLNRRQWNDAGPEASSVVAAHARQVCEPQRAGARERPRTPWRR